jgi:uncharacterized membrane protein YfcA
VGIEHGLLLLALGLLAGGVGALVGIGGGIIITPVLAMYLGVPMHQAIGVSLTAVIATSTATSSVYVERGLSNIRLGMTLEIATTLGAAIAAIVAGYIHRQTLAVLFSLFLVYTASSMVKKAWGSRNQQLEPGVPAYEIKRYPLGLGASLLAGGFSGLLGIGGGPVKVPIMYLFMGVPLRVATATSNFMIGVTAATSAYIYYGRGDIPLYIAAPIVIGVFAGSLLGARIAPKVKATYVLWLLVFVTAYLATSMLYKVLAGRF